MYDGQLELEYTCVCCHTNTYPRRLSGGWCSDCLIGGMTPEELAAEATEHEQDREDYKERHLWDYARDTYRGHYTVEQAAQRCYASVAEMQAAVDEVRAHEEEADRNWAEHIQYCRTQDNARHLFAALARGRAHGRKVAQ